MLYAIFSLLLRERFFKEKIKWSLVKTKCWIIWPYLRKLYRVQKALRPFLMGKHYLFSQVGKSRKDSVWRGFAPNPHSSSRDINSTVSPILKSVLQIDIQTFSFQCKLGKRFTFRFAFSRQLLLGSSAKGHRLPLHSSQPSACRCPALEQAPVSSLLPSHSCKFSENFSIKWIPWILQETRKIYAESEKRSSYYSCRNLPKKHAQVIGKNKKTDTWFAKSGNWWLIKGWWLLMF